MQYTGVLDYFKKWSLYPGLPWLINTQVLQENMDLAEEILFDLKSLLKNDGRPGRSTRMLQDMVEIDPDDPKRLLRIS